MSIRDSNFLQTTKVNKIKSPEAFKNLINDNLIILNKIENTINTVKEMLDNGSLVVLDNDISCESNTINTTNTTNEPLNTIKDNDSFVVLDNESCELNKK